MVYGASKIIIKLVETQLILIYNICKNIPICKKFNITCNGSFLLIYKYVKKGFLSL